jgi:opacity protein-like surface antigen
MILAAGLLFASPVTASPAEHASGLTIKTSVAEIFDDNVTFAESKAKADVISLLSLGLGLKGEGRLGAASLDAGIRQRLFARNADFNNTEEELRFDWRGELSKRDRFSMVNAFVHAEEPRSFEDAFGQTNGRYGYSRNRVNLAYTRDVAKQLSISGAYGNELYNASRDDLRDSWQHQAGAQADWILSAMTIARGRYEFSHRSFDPGGNATRHTTAAGVQQYLTSHLYAEAMAGVSLISASDAADTVKPMFLASLTHDVDERTKGVLSFTKETATTSSTAELFSSWRVSGNLRRQLSRRLNGEGSVFDGQGSYGALDIDDRLAGADAGLAYELRPDMTGRVSYAFSRAASNRHSREYDKNVVLVGLTAEF